MQIEVGKYYRTRDGRKVGPMYRNSYSTEWPMSHVNGIETYTEDGIYKTDLSESAHDLIAEWTNDEPAKPSPTLSSETIDQIAIDSLRWHMLRDMEPLQREAFRIVLRYYGASV